MARIAQRNLRITGSCPSGCWYSCDPSGRNCFCDCHDVHRGFRGTLGVTDGTKKLLAVGFLMAAAIGGAVAGSAIKKHTVRRRY
jgi:hypothetical protein